MTQEAANRPTLREAGLDFYRYGYFARPMRRDQIPSQPLTDDRWFDLQDLIGRLTRGDFSAAHELLKCSRQTADWRLKAVATSVLGHAGSVDCFREMRGELESLSTKQAATVDVATRELILLYARAFASWGRLDVVPVLLDHYLTLRTRRTPEIALLPLLMADLLSDDPGTMIAHEPPEDQLEEYLNFVMNQYDALAEELGSDKVLLFRGALQSTRGIAESMRHVSTSYVASELHTLRRRFEPATGIDCSEIFLGTSVRPLVAAEIAERFLESSEAVRFEPGLRYFFGHHVPD